MFLSLALVLVSILAAGDTSTAVLAQPIPSHVKFIFPSQDDQNVFTGAGMPCDSPPSPLKPLEDLVAKVAHDNYIPYDIAPLNRRHVLGLYYVYEAKACRRLQKHFPANVFVMARLKLLPGRDLLDSCVHARYDVEIKVYSTLSNREGIVFRQASVARDGLGSLLVSRERQLLSEILAVALP